MNQDHERTAPGPTGEADGSSASPWAFVPVPAFEAPARPAGEVTRSGLARFFARLRGGGAPAGREPGTHGTRLRDPGQAARAPDLDEAVDALEAALGPWLDGAGGQRAALRVIVATPHSPVQEIVSRWSARRGVERLPEPEPAAIPGDAGAAFECLDGRPADRPVWLPGLERYFLRHADGLPLMRGVLERLTRARSPTVVVSDAWAWTYLRHALGLRPLERTALTLRAFGASDLQRWFRALAPPDLEFRVRGDDARVLDAESPPRVLEQIAAHVRGNPGLALETWRDSLLEGSGEADREIVEVCPWSEREEPDLSLLDGRDGLFLAHTLLVHGGLPEAALAELVALPRDQLARYLCELESERAVEEAHGRWRVSALAYPHVRARIADAGYWVDEP